MKSGFITVIGLPNSGKSSLVNKLVNEHVSIVTAKPQTTRKRTLGIISEKDKYQMVFVDTPGFIEAEAGLNKFLKSELDQALKDINVVIATIYPKEFRGVEKPWALRATEHFKTPVIYVATQVDREMPDLEKWKYWTDKHIYLTSSVTGNGLDQLKEKILELLPEGPEYYDPEIYTNQTLRELSSEIVRKNCFESLHQEIPYGLAVNIRDFEEGNMYRVHADIVIARENHKAMVIGQKGAMLKRIGTASRLEMEKSFGQKVFLQLHVVVKDQWMKNAQWLEELGYGKQ